MKFCMVVDLDNTYRGRMMMIMKMMMMMMMIMMMMMMMMNMMMKIKKAITRTILKLGSPDFAWYKI